MPRRPGMVLLKSASLLRAGGTDMHVQLPIRPRLYAKMLTNPSLEEFHEYTRMGERATWPLIPMIGDRTPLSRMFGNAIGLLMTRMAKPARGTRAVTRKLQSNPR